jgi:predicted ABC-type ATPase
MAVLYVLGGANGVGKTTWYYTGIEQGYFTGELPFINIDQITIEEFGGYSVENIHNAEQVARHRIGELIKNASDFMMESNLSKNADYEWISAMRKHGYTIVLFFLSTNDVEINKLRVQQRVLEGGHDIAPAIIEQRNMAALGYLKSRLSEFSEVHLIDVSGENSIEMATLEQGNILFEHPQAEVWVQESLYLIRRFQEKFGRNQNQNC